MPFIESRDLRSHEPLPGWEGRFFHSENVTFAYYSAGAGSSIHEHRPAHTARDSQRRGTSHAMCEGDMRHRFHRRPRRCARTIFAPELQKARRALPKIVLGCLTTFLLTGLVGVFHADSAWARSDAAPEGMLRRPPAKPTRTVLALGEDGTRLHLKFA